MGCSKNQKERRIRLFLVYYIQLERSFIFQQTVHSGFLPLDKKLPALQRSLDDELTTEFKVWKQTSRVGVLKRVSLIVDPHRGLWALDKWKKKVHNTKPGVYGKASS